MNMMINPGNISVGMMKTSLSMTSSNLYDEILNSKLPVREDFESDEEFKKANIQFMCSAIDKVREFKYDMFTKCNDEYGEMLSEKNSFSSKTSDRVDKLNSIMSECAGNVVKSGMFSILTSLLLIPFAPIGIPVVMVYNGYKIAKNLRMGNDAVRELSFIKFEDDSLKALCDNFYDIVSNFRSDWYNTNRELDLLKNRALKGENIMSELLEICHPTRAGLNYIDSNHDNMFIMGGNGINIISSQDIPAELRSKLEGNGELTENDVENLFGILLGTTEDKSTKVFQKK